jgi:peptide-methionine (R)-S-oxide reductase
VPRPLPLVLALVATLAAWLVAFRPAPTPALVEPARRAATAAEIVKTEADWQRQLAPLAFEVLRRKGTERAFTGRYWKHDAAGVYRCAGCGAALFSSRTKYDSGTGWPSFWQPLEPEAVATAIDDGLFERRVEVLPPLRRPPGPRVRGRPAADGSPLLPELGCPRLRAGTVTPPSAPRI